MTSASYHYNFLRLLEQNPEATQRQLAQAMGLLLGKTHYPCTRC